MATLESELKAEHIEIRVKGWGTYLAEFGISAEKFISRMENLPHRVVALIEDNQLKDLHHTFKRSCTISLVDVTSEMGMRIYRRTGIFMMLKACRELFPERKLIIKHSLSNGLFCEFLDQETNAQEVGEIERHMKTLVARDLPIQRIVLPKEEANEIFRQQQQMDRIKLFSYWDKDYVHIHELDGLYEYFYGHMLPRTSYLTQFKLLDYPPGMILQTLEPESPDVIAPWIEHPKLFAIYADSGW